MGSVRGGFLRARSDDPRGGPVIEPRLEVLGLPLRPEPVADIHYGERATLARIAVRALGDQGDPGFAPVGRGHAPIGHVKKNDEAIEAVVVEVVDKIASLAVWPRGSIRGVLVDCRNGPEAGGFKGSDFTEDAEVVSPPVPCRRCRDDRGDAFDLPEKAAEDDAHKFSELRNSAVPTGAKIANDFVTELGGAIDGVLPILEFTGTAAVHFGFDPPSRAAPSTDFGVPFH